MQFYPKIDKVQLHMLVPDVKAYTELISAVYGTAESHGVKSHKIQNETGTGRYLKIQVDKDQLEMAARASFGRYWLMYRFNGVPDIWQLMNATAQFDKYDFERAVLYGRVKALELALDIPGLHPDDYLLHMVGTKTSHVYFRDDHADDTAYSGSRKSPYQLVMYDKARERKEKNRPCEFEDLMRIELRIRDRTDSLDMVIASLMLSDPFHRALVVQKAKAVKLGFATNDWHLFFYACSDMGVSNALRQFPSHKKTFLKYLSALQDQELKPRIEYFREALKRLYPMPSFWEELDKHLGEDGEAQVKESDGCIQLH